MNNKGFAITGILYGLMVTFILMVLSLLAILSSKKNRLMEITGSITNTIDFKEEVLTQNINLPYVTEKRGKYVFIVNGTYECSAYLPPNAHIIATEYVIKVFNYSGGELVTRNLALEGDNCPSIITTAVISKIYS